MATTVPPAVASEIALIADASVPEGARLRKLQQRARERGAGPDEVLSWQLAGIGGDPVAYRRFDDRLTKLFASQSNLNYPSDGEAAGEVILGSGYTAATIAATRDLAGFPKPLVLEFSEVAGGAFAVTRNPSFWLNSENTGGLPGAPWDGQPSFLNWLPGAPVQAPQISGREIADNAMMRFLVRTTLIMHARVITRATVTAVTPRTSSAMPLAVSLASGRVIYCKRVYDARGIGPEMTMPGALSWSQAMALLDTDFPFEGKRRVAVIGGGKAALCAVEALLGMGPDATMRSYDAGGHPLVDLYGQNWPLTREQWQEQLPGRYVRIGSHLPTGMPLSEDDEQAQPFRGYGLFADLKVRRELGFVTTVPGGVLVNGRFYDLAIACTGHRKPPVLNSGLAFAPLMVAGRVSARKASGCEVYQAGPCAQLPFDAADYESQITGDPDNLVAMHRLGPLTANLASALPGV